MSLAAPATGAASAPCAFRWASRMRWAPVVNLGWFGAGSRISSAFSNPEPRQIVSSHRGRGCFPGTLGPTEDRPGASPCTKHRRVVSDDLSEASRGCAQWRTGEVVGRASGAGASRSGESRRGSGRCPWGPFVSTRGSAERGTPCSCRSGPFRWPIPPRSRRRTPRREPLEPGLGRSGVRSIQTQGGTHERRPRPLVERCDAIARMIDDTLAALDRTPDTTAAPVRRSDGVQARKGQGHEG